MKIHARSLVLHGAALTGLLLLAACGKHGNEPAAAPPAASTAAAPAPAHTAPVPARTGTTPAPAAPGSAAVPASAGTSAAATPAPTDVFKVDAVTLGEAVTAGYKITKPATTFASSQNTIYASVATTGSTAGATLSAHFSYLEGKGQDVTTISQTIATDGPATTTFKLRNPNDWPAGKYKVEIAIDGKPVTSQTFEVKAA
jgi:pyruvate/2-oxoglutarate dehydrogenase complex dihydrolipoamide acyltransferase (E2) component